MAENSYPAQVDLNYYRGNTDSQPVKFENLDLTGYELRMHVRAGVDERGKLLDLSLSNGGITVNEIITDDPKSTTISLNFAGDGSNAALLSAAQKLPAEQLVYDLEGRIGNSVVTLMRGSFNVEGDVTK